MVTPCSACAMPRTYLAWKSIVEDVQNRRIDLGTYQADQAKRAMDGAEDGVKQMVRETYRWLMVPTEDMVRGSWHCAGPDTPCH